MTTQQGPTKDKPRLRKQSHEEKRAGQEPLQESVLAGPISWKIGSPRDLPDHITARSQRQASVLQLQQLHGNRYVQGILARQGTNGSIQRQDEPEQELGTEGLGLEEKLEGHPSLGMAPAIQREGEEESTDGDGAGASGTTANITLTVNDPNVTRPSQAEIEASHSGANIAGWTTPADGISVGSRDANSIDITITIDFEMELASEYIGDRLNILRDHEDHHCTIGANLAQEHLVDNLRTALEAMPDFRNTGAIQTAFQTAHTNFVRAEGTDSRAFDAADYSRMEGAYYGLRTPLADLASATPAVQTMVTTIDNFNSGATAEPEAEAAEPSGETAPPTPEESGTPAQGGAAAEQSNSTRIIGLIQPVIDARSALATVDVDRLQYNNEFKGKVSTASGHVDTLTARPLNEAAQSKLQELQTTLASFTWTPV
jgi:hypothetical protein